MRRQETMNARGIKILHITEYRIKEFTRSAHTSCVHTRGLVKREKKSIVHYLSRLVHEMRTHEVILDNRLKN